MNHLITKYWISKQFDLGQDLNILVGGNKTKWTSLEHNGVLFPPEYEPHNIPLIYNNMETKLSPLAEEYAMAYARYIETPYAKDKTFNKNFWNGWKKILGKEHIIQNLEGCDFKQYYNIILQNKEKMLSTNDKVQIKQRYNELIKKYKVAIIDNKEQQVSNFIMEPPGIFIGRGCHPKLGTIKKRILPNDIIINNSKGSKIDEPAYLKYKDGKYILQQYNIPYKKIIHDRHAEWLSAWADPITGKIKYIRLGATSDFKAISDIKKFDLARKLKKNIKQIRLENEKNMSSSNIKLRQISIALFFIDKLALRIGNEKGSDAADTVGVVSLRLEHIKLHENYKVTLNFLGKDSVRFTKTIIVENIIYDNLEYFMQNKSKDDQLFDKIQPTDVNVYLQQFMKNLTAKVFRTYNASNAFQKELNSISNKVPNNVDKTKFLLDEFNKANAKVAQLCNHQKNITKSFNEQLEKLNVQIDEIKKKLKKDPNNKNLKTKLKLLKSKKGLKKELGNVSLGTSKINYIDPRITVAFMKKHKINYDKFMNKALQEKFKWAFDVDENFKF